jgi:hypothetical protein
LICATQRLVELVLGPGLVSTSPDFVNNQFMMSKIKFLEGLLGEFSYSLLLMLEVLDAGRVLLLLQDLEARLHLLHLHLD